MAQHARDRVTPEPPDSPLNIREWIIEALDVPMVLLSAVMLTLAVAELLLPLSPEWSRRLTLAQNLIWVLFVAEFALSFSLAPNKRRYLRRHWLTLVSLVLPFLRIFRALRALRFLRTFRVTRLVLLANRGLNQLATLVAGSRLAHLALIVLIVNGVGAAGIYFLERGAPEAMIRGPGDALWWSFASFAQLSHNVIPVTSEGRGWAVVIQLINLAVAGYLTAVIASYLIERDRSRLEGAGPDAVGQALNAGPCDSEELQARLDHLIRLLEERPPPRRARGAGR